MPAARKRSHALRRPAYENLQGRKPRFRHVGRAASGGTLSDGDLSPGRAARTEGGTWFELIVAEGLVEGENVSVEYRWADNQINRVSAMATELVRRKVAVIVAAGGNAAPD